jgi:hypothetical protein
MADFYSAPMAGFGSAVDIAAVIRATTLKLRLGEVYSITPMTTTS